MTKKNATPKNETDRRLVGIARRCRFSATPKTKPTAAGSELLVGVAAARSELLVGVAAKPPSHERLTCNYTQPRKQRVCFFKKARRAGFFLWTYCIFSANFWTHFIRISRQIPEKSDVCRFINQIYENKLENCRNFNSEICEKYSFLFIITHLSP